MSRTTTLNDLARELDIPVATLRRYLKRHGHCLDINKNGKNYVIAEESLVILQQIRQGYTQGLSSREVDNSLRVAGVEMTEASLPSRNRGDNEPNFSHLNEPNYSALIEALSVLEKTIIERFEQQGEILSHLAEAAAAMQLHDPEVQRMERVNARLNEWRIERKLESDAMTIWADLPPPERIMRTGLFKTEENTDKRERFVREYVDKHFDDEIRKIYGG